MATPRLPQGVTLLLDDLEPVLHVAELVRDHPGKKWLAATVIEASAIERVRREVDAVKAIRDKERYHGSPGAQT